MAIAFIPRTDNNEEPLWEKILIFLTLSQVAH